jgi:hypothetical protein
VRFANRILWGWDWGDQRAALKLSLQRETEEEKGETVKCLIRWSFVVVALLRWRNEDLICKVLIPPSRNLSISCKESSYLPLEDRLYLGSNKVHPTYAL